MLESIIDGVSVGGGSVLGGILSLGTSWIQHRNNMEIERLKFEHRALELNHELQLIPLEMQRGAQEHEAAIELTNSQGTWAGLQASHMAAAAEGPGYGWVNAIRSLVRPVLTIGATFSLIGAGYGYAGLEAQSMAMDSMLITSQTAITWWFGDRAISRSR
jgi:hypothetical protein